MKGLHQNVKSLITLMRKARIKHDNILSIEDVEGKITEVYKHRSNFKRMAKSLSIEYCHQIAQGKEEAGGNQSSHVSKKPRQY